LHNRPLRTPRATTNFPTRRPLKSVPVAGNKSWVSGAGRWVTLVQKRKGRGGCRRPYQHGGGWVTEKNERKRRSDKNESGKRKGGQRKPVKQAVTTNCYSSGGYKSRPGLNAGRGTDPGKGFGYTTRGVPQNRGGGGRGL